MQKENTLQRVDLPGLELLTECTVAQKQNFSFNSPSVGATEFLLVECKTKQARALKCCSLNNLSTTLHSAGKSEAAHTHPPSASTSFSSAHQSFSPSIAVQAICSTTCRYVECFVTTGGRIVCVFMRSRVLYVVCRDQPISTQGTQLPGL